MSDTETADDDRDSTADNNNGQDIISQILFPPELQLEKEKLEQEAHELGVRYDELKVHLADAARAVEVTEQMTAILGRNSEIVAELQEVYKKAGLAPNTDAEPAEATAITAPTAATATATTVTKRLSSGSAANPK